MLELTPSTPRYAVSFDIFSLPEEHQQAVRDFGMENEYSVADYSDGDYYLILDFSLLRADTTPDDVLQSFLDADSDDAPENAPEEEDYPYKKWSYLMNSLSDYIAWLRALRFIAGQLPPEWLADDAGGVAISVWH